MRRVVFGVVVGLASVGHAASLRHNYDLKNVLWKVSINPGSRTIEGDTTNTVTLTEDTETVQFHCMNLHISSVKVGGQNAKCENADDILTVHLPTAGRAGTTLDVETSYTGSPLKGLYFVDPEHAFPAKTGMVYSQGEGEDNRNWIPTYDLPDDKATAECYITVPKSWKAISNGKLLGVKKTGTTSIWHWKMDQPFSTYLISVVAGEYVEGKSKWHDVPVSYAVPPGLEREGKLSFGTTPKMIDLYSRLTGVDYPYAKFSQEVVGDFVVGGMENITAVTQMIRTLHPANSEPLNDSTGLVAHELAHQWFGDLETCGTWEHIWLNEGFATFMPLFLDREWYGQDRFDLDRYQNFEGAIDSIGSRSRKDVPGSAGSVTTVTMGSPYPGGASRILMLMHRLTAPVFWKGIHTFLTTYRFKPATTAEFFRVMSEVSGQNLDDFQSQWYHTAATPSLSVRVEGADLVVDQLSPYYTLDVPVWFLKDGSWIKKDVHVSGATTRAPIGGLASSPFLFDPEVWTLMELSYKTAFTPAQIKDLYVHAPNAGEKARIVAELFPSLSVEDRIELAEKERYAGLVSMIAGRLGEGGESYLLELTHSPNVRIVSSAVLALAAMPQSARAVARLEELVQTNGNEALREQAMRALLAQTTDESLAKKSWSLKAFDDGFQGMALGWYAKHAPETARTMDLQILAGYADEPIRVAACQGLAVANHGHGDREVFAALAKVAQENSYFARVAAIRALGSLGDPEAIPVLKAISPYSPGGVVGSSQASLKLLGAK
jgi:hypothetical protein